MNFIVLLVFVVIYKMLSNLYFYFRIKHLSKSHSKWIVGKAPNFPTYKSEVINLFKRAGIQNILTPTVMPIGCNKIASFNADVFTNFPSTHIDIVNGAVRMFYEAEGTFRHRFFEALNPIYWIELVLFAPKKLLAYLSFDENKTLFKACNVLLTFIWWSVGVLFTFFHADLNNLLAEFMSQLNNFF